MLYRGVGRYRYRGSIECGKGLAIYILVNNIIFARGVEHRIYDIRKVILIERLIIEIYLDVYKYNKWLKMLYQIKFQKLNIDNDELGFLFDNKQLEIFIKI